MEQLKNVLVRVFTFIWKYKFSILFVIFLYLICKSFSRHHNQFLLITLSFFFLSNGLSKSNKIVSCLVTILLSFLITIDAYFGFVLGESLSLGILESILSTNKAEVNGVLFDILSLAIPLFVVVLLLFFLSQKELKRSKLNKTLSFCLFGCYWLFFVPIYTVYKLIPDKKEDEVYAKEHPMYMINGTIGNKFPLILHNITTYLSLWEQSKASRKYRSLDRVLPSYISLDSTAVVPEKIYLVIGESAIRKHHSLYGYNTPTTPFLDSLNNQSSFLHHYNGISAASYTAMAMPMLLSFATPIDDEPLYKYKNLIELAQMAGYETSWISSQAMIGFADSDIYVFSSISDKRYHSPNSPSNDLLLTSKLKEELEHSKRQFFVLHLEGSHRDYLDRFDDKDAKAIEGVGGTVDYDRTIHHTDRFFRDLYSVIEEDSSSYVLLYVSDHAEVVNKGHGLMSEGRVQFEIPFLTINNAGFALDSVVSKYVNQETKLANNLSTINIISEMMGYKFSKEEVEKVKNASKYVKHADNKVYLFDDLKK